MHTHTHAHTHTHTHKKKTTKSTSKQKKNKQRKEHPRKNVCLPEYSHLFMYASILGCIRIRTSIQTAAVFLAAGSDPCTETLFPVQEAVAKLKPRATERGTFCVAAT